VKFSLSCVQSQSLTHTKSLSLSINSMCRSFGWCIMRLSNERYKFLQLNFRHKKWVLRRRPDIIDIVFNWILLPCVCLRVCVMCNGSRSKEIIIAIEKEKHKNRARTHYSTASFYKSDFLSSLRSLSWLHLGFILFYLVSFSIAHHVIMRIWKKKWIKNIC
jgi:hypothetical protein